jgi:hypothetical protein
MIAIRFATALLGAALCLSACGGSSQEAKTPDEKISEGDQKLRDMEKETPASGMDEKAQEADDEVRAGEQQKAAEAQRSGDSAEEGAGAPKKK